MTQTTTKDPRFIQEWTAADFKKVEKAIQKHFAGRTFENHKGERVTLRASFKSIDEYLGLAYTSSSSCAMYGICNVHIKWPENTAYHYSYIAVSEAGDVYAELNDNEENELFIKL